MKKSILIAFLFSLFFTPHASATPFDEQINGDANTPQSRTVHIAGADIPFDKIIVSLAIARGTAVTGLMLADIIALADPDTGFKVHVASLVPLGLSEVIGQSLWKNYNEHQQVAHIIPMICLMTELLCYAGVPFGYPVEPAKAMKMVSRPLSIISQLTVTETSRQGRRRITSAG